jgi:hypothetical protein
LLAAAAALVDFMELVLRVETVHLTLLFLPMAVKAVLVAEAVAAAVLVVQAVEQAVKAKVLLVVETL